MRRFYQPFSLYSYFRIWLVSAAMVLLNGQLSVAENAVPASFLYPVQNQYRNVMDLSGIWSFKTDPDNQGNRQKWFDGLTGSVPIAVPGSWNDQIEGLHNYLGHAWYQTETFIPAGWQNERIFLRIRSAVYASNVWVNGKYLGAHEGGHLPFSFEITDCVHYGKNNRISIQVENLLQPDRVPTGNVKGGALNSFPATNYDFFPYSGLNRKVMLYTVPRQSSINDLTVKTDFQGNVGKVNVTVIKTGLADEGRIILSDRDVPLVTVPFKFRNQSAEVEAQIPQVKLWSPGQPHLYQLTVELTQQGKTVDSYSCQTGVRTVAVKGNQLLLNGSPVYLKGFGKHEDFPIFGRGTALPVSIKDFELMKWVGANSFRTSHYPYDESIYDLADREGFLIIDEIPAVGLVFFDGQENVSRREAICRQQLNDMIARDKNHPSVIIWSVANEPNPKNLGGGGNFTGAEQEGENEENRLAKEFLGGLVHLAKQLDSTRPASFVGVMGGPSEWLECGDLLMLNRYYGWYSNIGDLSTALRYFSGEMDKLYQQYHKPIIVTEFGADAVAGTHATANEMFSEEFQKNFIQSYLDIANTKDYISGMMVWCFADFQTGQGLIRVGSMNLKGVFTQSRKPKMAAEMLRSRWTKAHFRY